MLGVKVPGPSGRGGRTGLEVHCLGSWVDHPLLALTLLPLAIARPPFPLQQQALASDPVGIAAE